MEQAQIADLLSPFLPDILPDIPQSLAASLFPYLELLRKWNKRTNLTAVREPEEIVTRHFGESLFAARHLFPAGNLTPVETVADVGSGAGFPGIPIRLWAPALQVTLIESHHKKATFLREAIRALELTGIEVQAGRAERIARTFSVVTFRAVERFDEILITAASLVDPGGRLGLLISDGQIAGTRAMLRAFQWDEPHEIPQSARRFLFVGKKGSGT